MLSATSLLAHASNSKRTMSTCPSLDALVKAVRPVVSHVLLGTCFQQQARDVEMTCITCCHQSRLAVVAYQILPGTRPQQQTDDFDMAFAGCPHQLRVWPVSQSMPDRSLSCLLAPARSNNHFPVQSCSAVVVCRILVGPCIQQLACWLAGWLAGLAGLLAGGRFRVVFRWMPLSNLCGHCCLPRPCWHLLPSASPRFGDDPHRMPIKAVQPLKSNLEATAAWTRLFALEPRSAAAARAFTCDWQTSADGKKKKSRCRCIGECSMVVFSKISPWTRSLCLNRGTRPCNSLRHVFKPLMSLSFPNSSAGMPATASPQIILTCNISPGLEAGRNDEANLQFLRCRVLP